MLTKPESPVQKMLKKQFPTLLGIGLLVVALVVGLFFFSQGGTGVFAPRATPETTPQKIKITNVTDSGFTVSFLTDESVAGFIKYGTTANDLSSQASDDRDQLTGTVGSYRSHHITVRGLQPNVDYFFTLGTTSRSSFDNNGQPFSIKTAQRNGAPSAAKTVYGTVLSETGNPANNAIVYVNLDGVGEMSSLVKDSGSWAIPLSNARTSDGTSYASITDDMTMSISVQGPQPRQIASAQVSVGDAQPVETLTFGEGTAQPATTTTQPATPITESTPEELPSLSDSGTDSATITSPSLSSPSTTGTGGLSDITSDTTNLASTSAQTEVSTIDVSKANGQVVTTTKPKIIGKAAPQTSVSIEVNSETQIVQTVSTDADGNYELDLSELSQDLEPGEHTVTVSYTDPETGQPVQTTRSFTVEAPVTLAQATTSSPTPFGSSNPYPIGGATQSATATESASPSPSPTAAATSSGRTSQPATDAAVPVSGSVGTTFALILGGIFFVLAGFWSHWLASQVEEAALELDQ